MLMVIYRLISLALTTVPLPGIRQRTSASAPAGENTSAPCTAHVLTQGTGTYMCQNHRQKPG